MDHELLDLYRRASNWTAAKLSGAATRLDAPTTCEDWNVRQLISHMLETQRYFAGVARGEELSPPTPTPPDLDTDDPELAFARTRSEVLRAFAAPGVIKRTDPSLGIAFSDQLLHGWDLATSTAQDAAMPEGLPEAAYEIIHGRFTEDQRKGVFKPARAVPPNATAQERLLAYTGRDPSLMMSSRH